MFGIGGCKTAILLFSDKTQASFCKESQIFLATFEDFFIMNKTFKQCGKAGAIAVIMVGVVVFFL